MQACKRYGAGAGSLTRQVYVGGGARPSQRKKEGKRQPKSLTVRRDKQATRMSARFSPWSFSVYSREITNKEQKRSVELAERRKL